MTPFDQQAPRVRRISRWGSAQPGAREDQASLRESRIVDQVPEEDGDGRKDR